MKDLRGTTAIVTGASRGIGVYIARALAEEGVNLSLAARSADELEQVRAEMDALGVKAISTVPDVVKPEDRARLIEHTEAELGPVAERSLRKTHRRPDGQRDSARRQRPLRAHRQDGPANRRATRCASAERILLS